MATRLLLRGGTASEWLAANPVLASREPAVETDTLRQKIGDGVTPWASLPYAGGGSDTMFDGGGPGTTYIEEQHLDGGTV